MPKSVVLPFFDVRVTCLSKSELVEAACAAVDTKTPLRIGNLNLHGLYMLEKSAEFARYLSTCDIVLADGFPVALLASLRSGLRGPRVPRLGSTDWVFDMLDARPEVRVFAIGGTEPSSVSAAREAQRRWPPLRWHGYDGFDGRRQASRDLAELNRAPGLVLVGMGMPLQEEWILENTASLQRDVVANVGGLLDYVAGAQAHAPRWLGKFGLEWLYRFLRSPRRLGYRYFVEPLLLCIAVAMRVARINRRRD